MILPRSRQRLALLGALGASLAIAACSSTPPSTDGGDDAGDAATSVSEGGGPEATTSEGASGDDGTSSDAASDSTAPDAAPSDATSADVTGQDGNDAAPTDATSASDSSVDGQSGHSEGGSGAETGADAGPCPGQLLCSGICVPNDTANCGTCGNDCTNLHVASTVGCTAGVCTFPSMKCEAGWAHCSSTASDGCETDITKPANCGSCANACGTVACTISPAADGGTGTYACVKPVALAAGTQTMFALFSNGTIKAWGGNFGGYYFDGSMFGNGDTTTTQSATPVNVSTITSATAIAAGDGHACALLADKTVWCWGDNEVGQCGQPPSEADGGTDAVNTPQKVPGLTNVVGITAAWGTTCALLGDGTVQCWGLNNQGELGNTTTVMCDGADTCSSTPVPVTGISTATAISAGGQAATHFAHTCALLTGGTIKCWGANDEAQLGNGTRAPSGGPWAVYTPTQVSNITTATAVSSWADGSCALLSGGSVKCWGGSPGGALGNGMMNLSTTPVSVMNISDAASLSWGPMSQTNCAIRVGGTAECWGNGNNGQLGHGTPLVSVSDLPVSVVNLTGVTQMVGCQTAECALLSTGAVYCSGYDGDDELANSTAATNTNPTPLVVEW